LSQAYNEGNKNINAKNIQNFIVSNLNTINEDILLENNSNTNDIHNIPNNNDNYDNNLNNTYQNFNKISTNNTITENNENDTIETLKRKLNELQNSYENLKEENKKLINENYTKDGEISVIRKRYKSIEQENNTLKQTIYNKTKTIEEEKLQEKLNYENKINRLQTELQFKKQEIDELGIPRTHTPIKKEIKNEYDSNNSKGTSFKNEFPTQASFNHIPDNLKSTIYTNKSRILKEAESYSTSSMFEMNVSYDDNQYTNSNMKSLPENDILDKVMTCDISIQTVDDYSNHSKINQSEYQIHIPNSRFLFVQRLYNINIYSKLIKYVSASNVKYNNNSSQNLIYITIKKLLSCINDVIANSSIPITIIISPLEEFIGLSLENKNLKMVLTGLKLLFNIILNDIDSKNYILSYPIKEKVIENIHTHLSSMLKIVNQFNIKKNKIYQELSFKFQKKFSHYLFTVLQLMIEECKNLKQLSIYRTYIDENLVIDLCSTNQKMNITLNIIQWFQYLVLDSEIEKLFQNKSILEPIAMLLKHLNDNENEENMEIQLNIIRLLSLIIAKDNYSLKLISESHTVISNVIYVLQSKLDIILEEKNSYDKNIMAIIKEGIKFIHAIFTKAPSVFKILDNDESINYVFIRLLSRLIVSKYYEDNWSYFIDDIYDIINELLESILIGTPHENILKSLNPEEYEIIEDISIKNK